MVSLPPDDLTITFRSESNAGPKQIILFMNDDGRAFDGIIYCHEQNWSPADPDECNDTFTTGGLNVPARATDCPEAPTAEGHCTSEFLFDVPMALDYAGESMTLRGSLQVSFDIVNIPTTTQCQE